MRLNERQGGGRTYESGAANEREFGKGQKREMFEVIRAVPVA